jgi:hypothetical protein
MIKVLAGIESLDSEVHRLMRKGTDLLQVLALLKWCREYDLVPIWFLLYGIPGEPAAAYERMAALAPFLYHLVPPADCGPVKMLRFSPLFDETPKDRLKPIASGRAIYPFDDEDIMDISICFDWDYRVSAAPERSIESCLSEISRWMDAWKKEPPLLLFKRQEGGTLRVFDTRPPGGRKVRVLDELSSAACLACDAPTSFPRLKESLDGACPEDPVLRECLDGLIRDRLLVSEGDRYLCLANDLDVMKEHCSEFGVQILGMED